MSDYTQSHRLLALENSPVGDDVLLLTGLSGEEALSRPFQYQLEMLSTRKDIAARDLVGKRVAVRLTAPDGKERFVNGYISRFAASGLNIRGMRLYRAELVPWLWFLTRASDCRIFQNRDVKQIVEEIFGDFSFGDFETREIKGSHPTWDYCVQYRETGFNFISRLLEQQGIFYWFRHEKDKHTLVLADHNGAFQALPESQVEYAGGAQKALSQSYISSWQHSYEFTSGRWVQNDYNFETPSTDLKTTSPTQVDLSGIDSYEIFDYPGEYPERDRGDRLTGLRMEEEDANHDRVVGVSNCRTFAPGGKFSLSRHECEQEKNSYAVVSVNQTAFERTYLGSEEEGEDYSNSFSCIPTAVPYRPPRITPKPTVQGPQTAVVVGPAGEEIHTDKYGRVKVQFHWDRKGEKNENSSCWVRVSYPWAGQGWGGIAIPRIGQEVIVDFLEGDPDRPIITGRVYNAEQMPPYELPANKTQSGVKSRSSQGGAPANCNEIRFEDKTGAEQLLIHAEKNQDIEVENDETHWVGHDRAKTIDNDETSHIKHDRTETVDNHETITIGQNRTEEVGANESITVKQNRTRMVQMNENITVAQNRGKQVGGAENISVAKTRAAQIGGNESRTVGGSQSLSVSRDRSKSVSGGETNTIAKDRSKTVNGGETTSVAKDRSESVGKNESVSVGENRSHSVGKNDSLSVGKTLSIDAGDEISIVTGKASILMKKDGTVVIKGKDITIDGSGQINIKAKKNIVMKGQKILQN